MKAPSAFQTLLKNEFALGRFWETEAVGMAIMIVIYWVCAGAFPWVVLFGNNTPSGNISMVFAAGFLPIMGFMFLSAVTVCITYATVPAFSDLLAPGNPIPGGVQHRGALEFMFTRAVDRRILFRARAAALFIIVLTPFFLNVLVSPFAPDTRFIPFANAEPVDSFTTQENVRQFEQQFGATEAVWRFDKFQEAFPSNHNGVIRHGAVAYAAWLAWGATLALLLLLGYGTLIARLVKPNNWWTAIYPGVPIFLLFVRFILAVTGFLTTHNNIYENSFLLFSTHPLVMSLVLVVLAVVIQIWCERRFSQLEIL